MDVADLQLSMSRPFRAGALNFFVATTDERAHQQIERVLRDLPSPVELEGEFECFVFSRHGVAGDTWDVTGPAEFELVGASFAEAMTQLITGINLAALAAEPDRLHLHAAAVSHEGRVAIISAPRDTGKTSTVVGLLASGCDYLSDEAISIDARDQTIRAFAKPLSIKPFGRHLVPEQFRSCFLPTEHVERDVVHLAVGEVGAAIREEGLPAVVVILRRERPAGNGEPRLDEIHPADAVVRLMGETMDARRYGPTAVVALATLVAQSRCVAIDAGSVPATAALIERLLHQGAPTPMTVEVLPPGDGVRTSVVSTLIGDRAVIHETESGVIVALDQAATTIWLSLGGWRHLPDVDLAGPVVRPFVDQLGSLGFLDATA